MTTEATTVTPTSTAPSLNNCPGKFAEPRPEHAWLQKLVGDWTFESECVGEPGQPAQKFLGIEKVKSLGELWIVGEGQGEIPGGGTGHMMITLL